MLPVKTMKSPSPVYTVYLCVSVVSTVMFMHIVRALVLETVMVMVKVMCSMSSRACDNSGRHWVMRAPTWRSSQTDSPVLACISVSLASK